jgi:hypothetical protein
MHRTSDLPVFTPSLPEHSFSGINARQTAIGKAWNIGASLKRNNPQMILHVHDLSIDIGQNPSIAGANEIVKGESYRER